MMPDYRSMSPRELLNELFEVVDELCDVIEELGFVKMQKSDERYALEAKRDILTERKYLIARLIDAKQFSAFQVGDDELHSQV